MDSIILQTPAMLWLFRGIFRWVSIFTAGIIGFTIYKTATSPHFNGSYTPVRFHGFITPPVEISTQKVFIKISYKFITFDYKLWVPLPRLNFNFSPLSQLESSSMFRQTACVVDWDALCSCSQLPIASSCLLDLFQNNTFVRSNGVRSTACGAGV